MKRKFILGLVITLLISICSLEVFAAEKNPAAIKEAIKKYKNKNYLGCISDLKIYTEQNPSSAIAWYYLGNSYMNISMQNEANSAFDKVVELNTVPKLTSYSIQAQLCMKDPSQCEYKNYTLQEIEQLKLDPLKFLEEYNKPKVVEEVQQDPRVVEINRLINGEFQGNIHPEADNFIKQESLKMEGQRMN